MAALKKFKFMSITLGVLIVFAIIINCGAEAGNDSGRVPDQVMVRSLTTLFFLLAFTSLIVYYRFRIIRLHASLQRLTTVLHERTTVLDKQRREQEGLCRDLAKAYLELEKKSELDPLTEIPNRRYFTTFFLEEWKRAIRAGSPISLVIADIDYFKNFNDTYGHLCGDLILKKVARTIQRTLHRPGDFVARFGGEEFAVVLFHTSESGAQFMAEKIRKAVEDIMVENTLSETVGHVTISLGYASAYPWLGSHPDELIARADQALYKAKAEGRNCARSFPPEHLPVSILNIQATIPDQGAPFGMSSDHNAWRE